MTDANFIKRKLEHYIATIDQMNDEEKSHVVNFLLTTNQQHFDKMHELLKTSIDINENLLGRIEEVESDIKFYQSFIQENGLGKRYKFFCKQKGVI